jgi:hypothetical protein
LLASAVSTAVVTVVALTGLEVIQVHKQSSCPINPCDNVYTCVRAHENTRVHTRLHATRHRIEDSLFFVLDVWQHEEQQVQLVHAFTPPPTTAVAHTTTHHCCCSHHHPPLLLLTPPPTTAVALSLFAGGVTGRSSVEEGA